MKMLSSPSKFIYCTKSHGIISLKKTVTAKPDLTLRLSSSTWSSNPKFRLARYIKYQRVNRDSFWTGSDLNILAAGHWILGIWDEQRKRYVFVFVVIALINSSNFLTELTSFIRGLTNGISICNSKVNLLFLIPGDETEELVLPVPSETRKKLNLNWWNLLEIL